MITHSRCRMYEAVFFARGENVAAQVVKRLDALCSTAEEKEGWKVYYFRRYFFWPFEKILVGVREEGEKVLIRVTKPSLIFEAIPRGLESILDDFRFNVHGPRYLHFNGNLLTQYKEPGTNPPIQNNDREHYDRVVKWR